MENNPSSTPITSTVSNNDYVSIETFFGKSKTALLNATDVEIEPLLTKRGYTTAIIAAKLAELQTLENLHQQQKKEYGEQYQATQNYNNAAALLHSLYIEHIEIARIVFKNDIAAQTALSLNGKRKRSASGYCNQALLFYKGSIDNAAYTAALAAKGITIAELTNGKNSYTNLIELEAKQAKETGEAQSATAIRDKAIDDFAEWFSEFKVMGKIALSSKPQLREKLGWKE